MGAIAVATLSGNSRDRRDRRPPHPPCPPPWPPPVDPLLSTATESAGLETPLCISGVTGDGQSRQLSQGAGGRGGANQPHQNIL